MKKPAQTTRTTTQTFTEIQEIEDKIVLLHGGNACFVIEVKATNFALLSEGEQQAKIGAYASLLNSLSFPIQIIVQSKKLDISSYLKVLDEEAKRTQNPQLKNQINLYRNFVADLVTQNSVLDKHFYLVVSYSAMEKGPIRQKDSFLTLAKTELSSKEESLQSLLSRINLASKTLNRDDLIQLFHGMYNGDLLGEHKAEEIKAPVVRGKP